LGASPFAQAIEAVARPLAFAERDADGAGGRLRDLEATVRGAAARARALAIPNDARGILEQVERAFAQPLSGGARAQAVESALGWLEPLRDPEWAEQALARPTSSLPGVGPKRAQLLARRGLVTLGDLLLLQPSRYDDRRTLCRVCELEVGSRATFAAQVLVGDFVSSRGRRGRGRHGGRAFQAVVGDDTGTVNLLWFHGGDTMHKVAEKGRWLLVTGDVRRYRFSKELVHPEIEPLPEPAQEGDPPESGSQSSVVAVYPQLEGIPSRALRRLVETTVAQSADLLPDLLPTRAARRKNLPTLADAVRLLHAPSREANAAALDAATSPARQRLVLEELFVLETGLALRRAARVAEPGIPLDVESARVKAAPAALPFRLTQAQRRAWGEIRRDLAQPHPMHRLLQGDVGSGKTAVAFLAAVAAVASGTQAALMAPTEILAEQHERTLRSLARAGSAASLRIARLSASLPRAEAESVRRELREGGVDLVVGTHALVQDEVGYANLGLAIVDEQHRFGVLQRQALGAKTAGARAPHTLVMTATPIPRTLALTLYGDLDLSVIDEMPPGRSPVATHVLRAGEGRRVVDLMRACIERGEQVYVVYPLVEESDKVDLRAATDQVERIRAAFADCQVDLVHGRLDAQARSEAMERFERGETQILVSTTVIEVGLDVPGATLMVVEHAERFGLAQLHQLRGRVGRGSRPGTCLLVARASSEESEARLSALLETTDGFQIADADLRIRGAGEFLGTRQSGRLPDLRIADLVRDARLVSEAREAALEHVRRDPGLRRSPELRRAVRARWGARLALVDVG
jgi:ATP-dependent DNA helicase RecG